MPLIAIDEPMEGVRRLTFDRPDKLNALSTPMIAALEAALDEIAGSPVRVVILRGAGRAFVAGADIAEYRGDRRAAFFAYQRTARRVFEKIERLPQPVIAAICGFALGGGFEIALCCDILVLAPDAQLGLPEGRLGLVPGGGGTQRLTRAVGKHAASEVMLAGWRLDAARAHQLGLAAAVEDDPDEGALRYARACLKVAPEPQAEMKRLIREGADAPLDAGLSYEQEVLFRLYSTHDGQEGVAAFLDKRDPQFRGREDG